MYNKLLIAVESALVNMTGCAVPCSHMEFKHVGSKFKAEHTFGFLLRFGKTEVSEEKEAYVYGFVSFVSEFGGSLGLFLGFSFLTVWDIFEPLFISFSKQIRYIKKWGYELKNINQHQCQKFPNLVSLYYIIQCLYNKLWTNKLFSGSDEYNIWVPVNLNHSG